MQKQNILYNKASFIFMKNLDGQLKCRVPSTVPSLHNKNRSHVSSCLIRAKIPSMTINAGLDSGEISHTFQPGCIKSVADDNQGELSDEDDDLCPVECVREFKTDEEFLRILEKAKETSSLVVVDFYRTSCGSCKYIEQGFSKLCKGSGDEQAPVIFLKHNVIDECDEQSEVAERLRIRVIFVVGFIDSFESILQSVEVSLFTLNQGSDMFSFMVHRFIFLRMDQLFDGHENLLLALHLDDFIIRLSDRICGVDDSIAKHYLFFLPPLLAKAETE